MADYDDPNHGGERAGLINQSITQNKSVLRTIIYLFNYSMFWYCGIIWLLLVIAFGGAFVLPLLGACTLSDCDSFINMSNQVLTGLFTAINLYAFPGRFARLWSLVAYGEVGVDAFGDSVPDNRNPKVLLAESYDPSTFYHFSKLNKWFIVFMLLTSAIAQFVNQVVYYYRFLCFMLCLIHIVVLFKGFHIFYSTYTASNTWPGVLWNNLFFLISLVTMVIAMAYEGYQDSKLRSIEAEKFPPTASTLIMGYLCKKSPTQN